MNSGNMKAMILKQLVSLKEDGNPLQLVNLPVPEPKRGEIRLKISVCGVCHTELDEIEGRTPPPQLPVVLGHEVVGRIDKCGPGVSKRRTGERVGVGWIFRSSGTPDENISPAFVATGRDANGGYAEYMTASEDYAYSIPEKFSDAQAAPLLCAGGVGYRALKLARIQDGDLLGLTGFGGSAHLVLQLVKYSYPKTPIFVFTRDEASQAFALELGAAWSGDTTERAPESLHAIIDTTPAWQPVVEALSNLRPGGRLVINAIRKEDDDKAYLQNLSYQHHLWMEKEIKTVANVTHIDLTEFLKLAAAIPIVPEVQTYALEQANQALRELKQGRIRGAKVLLIDKPTSG